VLRVSSTNGHPATEEPWFDRPMRWGQLTLAENDPGQYDPTFWLDFFRRTHCDGVCLSAGGIVAYYPTSIPLHHRSAWLGDTDPFGDLVAGCRAQGMAVIARTDPHAVREEVKREHPDWIAVDCDGNPRQHWANPELWITCALGPYNFEFMTGVHRELMSSYDLDGIFSNRWAGHGICYCEHCQAGFAGSADLPLPRAEHPSDPSYRKYVEWRTARLLALWDLWDGAIREIRPDARFIPNGFPDRRVLAEKADIFFIDHQGRSGYTMPWDNGLAAKQTLATMGSKPVGGIFSPGVSSPTYRWMDSVQSDAEVRVWVAEGIAHGFRPWFTKFSGTPRDTRWQATVERIYNWHHSAERYLRNEESLARVGLVFSEQTERFYRGRPEHGDWHKLGMYHALVEARVPFDMVHDRFLEPERLDRYGLLILPNIAALDDSQCAALRSFVERGGGLIATFETSLYDEWGVPRPDFGLADLFGVSYTGRPEGPLKNSYLTVNRDESGQHHPILRGLEDANRIINGVWRLDVRPAAEFPSPLTLVPSYPDLPMEDVYPRVPTTDIREVYPRDVGTGRVVYFPWDIDRTFYELMNVDHGRLLRNAVEWALREEQPVTVDGPGVIDVAVWRQRESMSVHLVNLTNPMMMKGPFRELNPVGPERVTIRLPVGQRVRGVRLLADDRPARFDIDGERLVLTVATIECHEVIAVDLE
jgi:hypothetical protein